MKKLKLKPVIVAAAAGAALTCSGITSANFINFMPANEVEADQVLGAMFGTIFSHSKHEVCEKLINHAEATLEGLDFSHDVANQGQYFPSNTATVGSTSDTIGSVVTEFIQTTHADILSSTFSTKNQNSACAGDSTFICSAEEDGALDVKTRFDNSTSDQRTDNGANQIRCVLTLGTTCDPAVADNASFILDLVPNTPQGNKPAACSFSLAIPRLIVDLNGDELDEGDITAARQASDNVGTAIETLFSNSGDSASANMIRAHVTTSTRDTVSVGSDLGFGS